MTSFARERFLFTLEDRVMFFSRT